MCARIVKRTRRKRFEFDRRRDDKEGGKGKDHELLEEPRSPSYEKNSQMLSTHIINQAYTSERHASRRLSKNSNVESCKELLRSITSITRSATSKRWAHRMSGKWGTERRMVPILCGCYCEKKNKATAREWMKRRWAKVDVKVSVFQSYYSLSTFQLRKTFNVLPKFDL